MILIVLANMAVRSDAQVGEGYWSFSNPKPFGFYVTSTSFIDDNTGLMVGGAGGIAKTIDGGGLWKYFSYTFTDATNTIVKPVLNEVQFINSNTAMAVGTNGAMAKSIDGGTTWTPITTPFYASGIEIYTLFFFDENNGYIAGEPIDGNTSIYKTDNGGTSWAKVTGIPEEGRAILKIRFSANGVGYFTGMHNGIWEADGMSSLVWKFADNTWTDYSLKNTTVFPNVNAYDTAIIPHGWDEFSDTLNTTYADNTYGLSQANWRGLAVISDSVIILGAQNNGMLIRLNTSTPAGSYLLLNNGTATYPGYRPLGSPSIYNMVCKDGMKITAPASLGQLISSADKGYTWAKQEIYTEEPEKETDFFAIDITPGNRYILGGSNGIVADSLSSWRKPYVVAKKGGFFGSAGLEDIKFLDADNGIAVGAGGTLLRTTNGGDTWEDKTTAGFAPWDSYTSLAYVTPTALYAAASNGQFFKSGDKGNTFDLLFQESSPGISSGRIESIDFLSEDTGFMVTNVAYDIPDDPGTEDYDGYTLFHNIAYRTVDGGLSWDSAVNAFPAQLYADAIIPSDLKFLNKNIGYIVGALGSIYKTIDGGVTWVQQTNIPSNISTTKLESIAIVDANIAYAVGWEGSVIKTTDGGATWVNANNGLPTLFNNFYKVLMYDANQGMVFASGTVYTTRDGGNTWTPYYAPVSEFMFAACFAPMAPCVPESVCKKVYVGTGMNGHVLKFDSDRVLPVKFSNLTGAAVTSGNQLFWTAFTQDAVKYFEVEVSSNGTTFEKVSEKIYPSGFSYQSYKWLHENVAAGRNYYRVKVYEQNGAVYYTNIVPLNGKNATGWKYQLSNGSLILNNTHVEKGEVITQVLNTAGQLITVKKWNQSGGAFNDFILLPPTSKGIHLVKIINAGTVYNFKILLQ